MGSAIELPTVDLGARGAGDELAAGLERLGFVELRNHGCDTTTAAELRRVCDEFFALDPACKARWAHPAPEANRGHRAQGSEALSYSLGEASPPDLFESFNCAPDDRATDHRLMQPTPWPDADVAGFSTAASAWFGEMTALSRRIDRLIDGVLGTALTERSQAGPDTMACIDYRPGPDGTEAALPDQQRMGAHSDYTTFTILLADPVPGLQIVDCDRGWVDVAPTPGALLLNVGDLLAMLTNDRWPSTLHRVVPMSAGAAAERRSVAYFHYPDLDVEIAPLAAFGAPRYEPVTVEQHLLGKLTAPKVRKAATGANTAGHRLRPD